ncbi:MAG: L-seryl-tRNA(Sec) selenium transferase [Oscillospiraceae bacterium]|nr:L-seryl-tRNA(Sec) selenium transferase [Oscillospiraceae bacterium]
MQEKENLLKKIPHVDKLIKHELIADSGFYRHEITEAVRDVLTDIRETLKSGKAESVPKDEEIALKATYLASMRAQKNLRRVVNGTGVILHSNLGRACVSQKAASAAHDAAMFYSTLEYDTKKGERGSRTAQVEKLLCDITKAKSALVVNNNAAAVLLALTAVASGGNIIVSRGELVEIGGAFRVPDIIEQCGSKLIAVGTTNKTRLSDFESAVNEDTKAILKVHTSNFKVVGFTSAVSVKELAGLGKSKDIPIIEDIGSGALVDVRRYGIQDEPLAEESLKDGADVVTFSGDKLLGGPQCGIILGNKKLIDVMKKHPLYRALRCDKMTIAALEATLRVYLDPRAAEQEIPVLKMLSAKEGELKERATKLCAEVENDGGKAGVIETKSVAGGGAVPGLTLKSYAVMPMGDLSADALEKKLRSLEVPIIGRIEDDKFLLDVRTMFEDDFEYIAGEIAKHD